MPPVVPTGFIVQLDMQQLARKLSLELGKKLTPAGAAMFLTRGKRMEDGGKGKPMMMASPFAFTDQPDCFYCDCDPRDLLERREIMRLIEIPARRRRESGELICPVFEW